MLQLGKHLLLRLRLEELFFRSALGDFTQRLSDMRETQHEPTIKIGKAQKVL